MTGFVVFKCKSRGAKMTYHWTSSYFITWTLVKRRWLNDKEEAPYLQIIFSSTFSPVVSTAVLMQSGLCKPYTFTMISFTSRQCSSFVMGNVPPSNIPWGRHLVEGGSTASLVCHKCTADRLRMCQQVWNVTNLLLKGWKWANEQKYWATFRFDYAFKWI